MDTTNATGADAPAGLGDELKQDAAKLGNVAGERLSSEAEAHKGEVASQARNVSNALEKAAGELGGEDTPDWLRSSLRQGAETLQRLADSVENKNPRELLDDLNTLGREHPGAFLGACAVAGFAIARVFKAGTSGAVLSQGRLGLTSGQGAPGDLSQVNAPLGFSQAGPFPGEAVGGSQLGGSGQSSASPYVGSGGAGDAGLSRAYSEGAV